MTEHGKRNAVATRQDGLGVRMTGTVAVRLAPGVVRWLSPVPHPAEPPGGRTLEFRRVS